MRTLLLIIALSVSPLGISQTIQDERKTIEVTFPETSGWVGEAKSLKHPIERWTKTKKGDASLEMTIGFVGRSPPSWERYLSEAKAADERFRKSKLLVRSGEILVDGRKGYLRALLDRGHVDSLDVHVQVPTDKRLYTFTWRGRFSDDPAPELASFLDSVRFLPVE